MGKKENSQKKDNRGRAWAMVVYPESAPDNWREIINNMHISWVESPLHDKDVNPDGKPKKPHWHVLLLFEGKKSFNQIKDITDAVHAPIPIKVESIRGMVRYFIHLDNPEKYQYKRSDLIAHGGADIDRYFEARSFERLAILKEMLMYIRDNHVTSYSDFIAYCITEKGDDWVDIATNHNTFALNKMIDAEYQKERNRYDFDGNVLVEKAKKEKRLRETDDLMNKIAMAKKMHASGETQKDIAVKLGVSERTVRRYLNS